MIREVWPRTPARFLKGRTPLEAAEAGDANVPLRAAMLLHDLGQVRWHGLIDYTAFRSRLGLEPEPPIDPATVDIDTLHLARLALVPVDDLDDDRLAALFRRAREYALDDVLLRVTRPLIDRPHLWERAGTDDFEIHAEMALQCANQERAAEAFDWIRKGRQAEPAGMRGARAPMWDMLEIRVRAASEQPQTWVPELAIVLERYTQTPSANEAVMLNLLEMGLVRMVPKPDQPKEYVIDSRPLQMLMAEYGPRVTTASGGLGVSATRGEIWTPGGATGGAGGGGGGLWTPGSGTGGSPPDEGKSKLILPGR
jgi:hypothetical protein